MEFIQSDLLKSLPDQFFVSLVKKIASHAAKGHDVINFGQGNPDQPTPGHIIHKLKEAAEMPGNHGYSPFRGLQSFREAAAGFYFREYDVELDPETEIAVLFGGKAGLVEAPLCLLNPGDTVLVPDPGYPDYWSGVAMANAKMEMMPLLEENDFLPDYGKLSDDLLAAARLMFLNYPNNPTGAVASREFFDETVELACKNEICVVHDFAYGAIGFDSHRPVSFLESPGAKEIGIEIYTLSKTYCMAGWRIGFAAGNKSVIQAINLFQDHLYVSLFGAVQKAAAEALSGPQDCLVELNRLYESRRKVLIDGFRKAGWDVEAPKGSFFAWLKVPDGFTSEQFSDYLLENAHIAVAPGSGFGPCGEGYVRAGLLVPEDRIKEAAARIEKLGIFKKKQ
ncbi:pyridoxal phosphate-dependent aminotransferase [Mesobacillus zeae]|uniref:Pyridoxal phosphate-dependent aminotransferase n=1 Tax=Mesobacillus zeae TaxID=1917180 RepID=A0A398BDB0_9BACI|nr:pyridoxal phosphate-dependent aminotransferase [Mesobacillus zeae]RID87797.1 pyridoxal phosphate-dependent aminotransferase [Mesobacillus zeae]